ncbi:MAG: hypothetical protein WCO51_03380 [bacterium]
MRIWQIGLITLVLGQSAMGQFRLPNIPIPDAVIPGINPFTKEDPIVSTKFGDAITEIPYLDRYDPKVMIPMGVVKRTNEGVFTLFPGAFSFDAQSYCLHAGTHGPGKGEGYLYAPLKGSKSGVIRNILKHSVAHPRIEQHNIQVLIWAILAQTKLSEASPEIRSTANQLLTADELKDLNKNALGVMADDKMSLLLDRVTPGLRPIFEAENRLRGMMSDATAPYERLANVAVLPGDPPNNEGGHNVPSGRWSYHPDGYFIHFFPNSYPETHYDVIIPGRFNIERDNKDRIALISDLEGNRIELTYDDRIEPGSDGGQVRAFAFKSIRFVPSKAEGGLDRTWEGMGWTLVGVPQDHGRLNGQSARFDNVIARYGSIKALKDEFNDELTKAAKASGNKDPKIKQGLVDLMDLSHVFTGLAAVIGSAQNEAAWVPVHLERVLNAWQYTFMMIARGDTIPNKLKTPPVGVFEFDPSVNVAVPANTGRQRLAQSARPIGSCSSQDNSNLRSIIRKSLQTHGTEISLENMEFKGSNTRLMRFYIPLNKDNRPLPTLICLEQAIAEGRIAEGTQHNPDKLLIGSIQQFDNKTRVTVRITNLETGEITAVGKDDAEGANDSAIREAINKALDNLGVRFGS